MPKKDDLPYMMGLKLRLYPNWKQENILWKNLNASRFIYNQLLANSWTDSRIIKNKLDKRYPIPEEYWRYGKNGKAIKKSQKRPTGLARITAQRYPWLDDDDLDSDMYDLIDKKLENKYHRYEVSNYSITSYESRHNLTYWENNEYYGFGLGAAGYIGNIRYTNTRNLSKYISGNYERQNELLTKEDKIKYEFILGLRLTKGINKDNFNRKYDINIKEIEVIKELINKGLLIDDKINIYVPKKYFYVLNDILVNFV